MKATTRPTATPVDLTTVRASDIMQRQLITVQAGDSLAEVERILAESGISGVPVLHEDGRVLGVLSMADIVRSHAEEAQEWTPQGTGREEEDVDEDDDDGYGPDAPQLSAEDVMSTDIATVAPDATLREIARTMVENQVHRVIVAERGRAVGLISTMDVLRSLAQ